MLVLRRGCCVFAVTTPIPCPCPSLSSLSSLSSLVCTVAQARQLQQLQTQRKTAAAFPFEVMKQAALQCLHEELARATQAGRRSFAPQQEVIAQLLLVCSRFMRMRLFGEDDMLALLRLVDAQRFSETQRVGDGGAAGAHTTDYGADALAAVGVTQLKVRRCCCCEAGERGWGTCTCACVCLCVCVCVCVCV